MSEVSGCLKHSQVKQSRRRTRGYLSRKAESVGNSDGSSEAATARGLINVIKSTHCSKENKRDAMEVEKKDKAQGHKRRNERKANHLLSPEASIEQPRAGLYYSSCGPNICSKIFWKIYSYKLYRIPCGSLLIRFDESQLPGQSVCPKFSQKDLTKLFSEHLQ